MVRTLTHLRLRQRKSVESANLLRARPCFVREIRTALLETESGTMTGERGCRLRPAQRTRAKKESENGWRERRAESEEGGTTWHILIYSTLTRPRAIR